MNFSVKTEACKNSSENLNLMEESMVLCFFCFFCRENLDELNEKMLNKHKEKKNY